MQVIFYVHVAHTRTNGRNSDAEKGGIFLGSTCPFGEQRVRVLFLEALALKTHPRPSPPSRMTKNIPISTMKRRRFWAPGRRISVRLRIFLFSAVFSFIPKIILKSTVRMRVFRVDMQKQKVQDPLH